AVETVKEWRTDRALRNLEAMLIVADHKQILTLSGVGDVIAPDEPVAAVGSGGAYAQAAATALPRHTAMAAEASARAALATAAATALLRHTDMDAEAIARAALAIAAEIDVFTSGNATVLTVSAAGATGPENGGGDPVAEEGGA